MTRPKRIFTSGWSTVGGIADIFEIVGYLLQPSDDDPQVLPGVRLAVDGQWPAALYCQGGKRTHDLGHLCEVDRDVLRAIRGVLVLHCQPSLLSIFGSCTSSSLSVFEGKDLRVLLSARPGWPHRMGRSRHPAAHAYLPGVQGQIGR